MQSRFVTSNATGVETPWQGLDQLLDALEDGRVDADDYVFDSVRQAWQPIRKHGGIVAAWDERMSFRPPEERRLIGTVRRATEGFPALSPEGITPVSSPAVSRIQARRMAHLMPEEVPAVRNSALAGSVALIVGVVTLIAVGLVWIVRGLFAGLSAVAR